MPEDQERQLPKTPILPVGKRKTMVIGILAIITLESYPINLVLAKISSVSIENKLQLF